MHDDRDGHARKQGKITERVILKLRRMRPQLLWWFTHYEMT